MSSSNESLDLLQVVVDLVRNLPPGVLNTLLHALESNHGGQDRMSLSCLAATLAMKEKLQSLAELSAREPKLDDHALAFVLRAAARAVAIVEAEERVEIAWTGPGTEAVPLRRVDQVVYAIVESAKAEVLLVTYAAYKAERAMKTLRDATDRGIRVKLVIELARESGGKISFDGLEAFRAAVPNALIYYWPLDRRKRDASDSSGAMHAKCLVADRKRAFVSSANLTDYALEANMELGLVIEGVTAGRLADHFDQLILRGELAPAPK